MRIVIVWAMVYPRANNLDPLLKWKGVRLVSNPPGLGLDCFRNYTISWQKCHVCVVFISRMLPRCHVVYRFKILTRNGTMSCCVIRALSCSVGGRYVLNLVKSFYYMSNGMQKMTNRVVFMLNLFINKKSTHMHRYHILFASPCSLPSWVKAWSIHVHIWMKFFCFFLFGWAH